MHKEKLAYIDEHCYAAAVRKGARAITQLFEYHLAPLQLRITQFTLLVAIARWPGHNLSYIANRQGMERTTLTRGLAPLHRRGLIMLVQAADHRAKCYQLTNSGAELLRQAIALWELATHELTDNSQQLAELKNGIAALIQGIVSLQKNRITTNQPASTKLPASELNF